MSSRSARAPEEQSTKRAEAPSSAPFLALSASATSLITIEACSLDSSLPRIFLAATVGMSVSDSTTPSHPHAAAMSGLPLSSNATDGKLFRTFLALMLASYSAFASSEPPMTIAHTPFAPPVPLASAVFLSQTCRSVQDAVESRTSLGSTLATRQGTSRR